MPFAVQRPLVAQSFVARALAVGVAATPLDPAGNKEQLIDTFAISLPVAAVNSIFIGNAGVAPGGGLEIIPGTTPIFIIDHGGRQLYELQAPVVEIATAAQCRVVPPESIPFVVWDLSQIFMVAAAPTAASIMTFRAMYI